MSRRGVMLNQSVFGLIIHVLTIAMLATALVIVPVSPADAQSWTRLKEADFPARVVAVVFSNGVTLDGGHSVTWGQWTVQFGPNPPVAEWRSGDCLESGCRLAFLIKGLACTNSVVGEGPCSMMIIEISSGRLWCFIRGASAGFNMAGFNIKCPTDVEFQ
jgi:hypothetical protein